MAVRHPQHCRGHSISSFNPTSCLRPPRSLDAISRCSDYDHPGTCSSSSIPSSKAFVVHPGSSSVREPSSPMVGCLGQVKRSSSAKGRHVRLLKLSKMFSDRSMSVTLEPSSKVAVLEEDLYYTPRVVSVRHMDPPLPVVIKRADAGAVNLWKRRQGGDGLEDLYIYN